MSCHHICLTGTFPNILICRKIPMAGEKTGRIHYELVTGWMESKANWSLACLLPWFVGLLGGWLVS